MRIEIGATAFARTPFARSSAAIERIERRDAALRDGVRRPVRRRLCRATPASDAKNTIEPRAARSSGRNARVGEIRRREIDRDLPIPHVESALGDRTAHRESAGHVHERVQLDRRDSRRTRSASAATAAALVRSHA